MSSSSPAASRIVLVTGASSGIGQATARLMSGQGARVFGTSRCERPAEGGVEMLQLDVRYAESIQQCIDHIHAVAGHLDVLVNNAGVMHEGFTEETTPAEAQAIFAGNFFGAIAVTNAVLPSMRARRQGRIINVGSLAAWIGEPGEGVYAASKAALARYTEALRHEVWHLGIKVSLVEPGAFTTGVLHAASTTEAKIADYDGPRESAHRTLHEALRRGEDPHKAAVVISKIAQAPKPRGRYGAGRDGIWIPLLKTLLPQRIVEFLLRRSYRLPS